jgi:hypothetical protein
MKQKPEEGKQRRKPGKVKPPTPWKEFWNKPLYDISIPEFFLALYGPLAVLTIMAWIAVLLTKGC